MTELLRLFLAFAKIGGFTFGGGLAMLPMMQREIVEKRGWATENELIDYYAIGQCTPGIIAVNTATFIGFKRKGLPGGIFATLGVVAPSVLIITRKQVCAVGVQRDPSGGGCAGARRSAQGRQKIACRHLYRLDLPCRGRALVFHKCFPGGLCAVCRTARRSFERGQAQCRCCLSSTCGSSMWVCFPSAADLRPSPSCVKWAKKRSGSPPRSSLTSLRSRNPHPDRWASTWRPMSATRPPAFPAPSSLCSVRSRRPSSSSCSSRVCC